MALSPASATNRSTIRIRSILATIAVLVTGCAGNEGESPDEKGSATARVLNAREVFEVGAVEAVEMDGFSLESAVCEVISPASYRPEDNIFGGRLVFHAFRVRGPGLEEEQVVLFASNHAATDGEGLIIPVNDAAIGLDQGFTPGSDIADPITEAMPGANAAAACAQDADVPAAVDAGDFDVEAWRAAAIEQFGPEEVFADGSKLDYVELAFIICDQSEDQRRVAQENLGVDYEGSLQQFIVDDFCTHV